MQFDVNSGKLNRELTEQKKYLENGIKFCMKPGIRSTTKLIHLKSEIRDVE